MFQMLDIHVSTKSVNNTLPVLVLLVFSSFNSIYDFFYTTLAFTFFVFLLEQILLFVFFLNLNIGTPHPLTNVQYKKEHPFPSPSFNAFC